MRLEWDRGHPFRLALIAAATIHPAQALRIAALVTGQGARAGFLGKPEWTAPLVAAGLLASIRGEAAALLASAVPRRQAGA